MCLHYLLANVAFGRVVGLVFIHIIVVSACHLLHFHIGGHWLLPIYLTDEALHAFGEALAHLDGHIGNHVDDFFLSLLCFVVSLDDITCIEVVTFIYLHHFVTELLISSKILSTRCCG